MGTKVEQQGIWGCMSPGGCVVEVHYALKRLMICLVYSLVLSFQLSRKGK